MIKEKIKYEENMAARRNTKQRAVITRIIKESAEHLDAGEIYRRAMREMPRISLATVYRNLRLLKEKQLIKEVHIDEAHHHYEMKHQKEHFHILCRECGKMVEFEYPVVQMIKQGVKKINEYCLIDLELTMSGYCKKCKKNATNGIMKRTENGRK